MNKLKILTAATALFTVIPNCNASDKMNMSGFPQQMKAFFKAAGFKDTSSYEYKAKQEQKALEDAQERAYSRAVAEVEKDLIYNKVLGDKDVTECKDKLWDLVRRGQYKNTSDEQKVWIETESSDDVVTLGKTKLEIVNEKDVLYGEYYTPYISEFKEKLTNILTQQMQREVKEKRKLNTQKEQFLDTTNEWLKDNKERNEIMAYLKNVMENAEFIKMKLKDTTKAFVYMAPAQEGKTRIYYSDVEYISDKLIESLDEFAQNNE